jgi:type II secretory pathway predicted ATPase ExeA
MYEAFYGLKTKPFQINTDPKFMWMGEKHKEALATLKYGIIDSKGFLLLTGDVGTGKTTLLHALLNTLDDAYLIAVVPNPGLEMLDFFEVIARGFRMKKNRFSSKGEFLDAFGQFLKIAHKARKKVLLIIDEVQSIKPDMLEEIRLLSNIEKQYTKLLNIFFIGQNEFNELLVTQPMRALRQRITLNYHVEPLTRTEVAAYIHHRLKIAGSTRKLFDSSAITEIMRFSKGYPRLINVICDHGLLTGFVQEKKTIDAFIIRECARELAINVPTEHRRAEKESRKEKQPKIDTGSYGEESEFQATGKPTQPPLPDNPMKTHIPTGLGNPTAHAIPSDPSPRPQRSGAIGQVHAFRPTATESLEPLGKEDSNSTIKPLNNMANRKFAEEIIAEFKPVDGKQFRKGLDELDLARSSVVRTSLSRIFRSSVNIQELMKTMDLEAERIINNDEMINLKHIKEKNTPSFLTVVIDLLWQEVARKYMTRRAQKALRILSPTENFHITDFPQVLISR